MPSIISHSFTGIFFASLFQTKKDKVKFWIFSVLCPILPDLDVIAFAFGIPYQHFLGHRGFFHSIFFALIIAIIIVLIFFKKSSFSHLQRTGLVAYYFVLAANHGLLDTLTSGGLGIAVFAPFDNTRYFYSVTPLTVSPIGIKAFFSAWGLQVIKSEIIWVWIPLICIFIIVKIMSKLFTRDMYKLIKQARDEKDLGRI